MFWGWHSLWDVYKFAWSILCTIPLGLDLESVNLNENYSIYFDGWHLFSIHSFHRFLSEHIYTSASWILSYLALHPSNLFNSLLFLLSGDTHSSIFLGHLDPPPSSYVHNHLGIFISISSIIVCSKLAILLIFHF